MSHDGMGFRAFGGDFLSPHPTRIKLPVGLVKEGQISSFFFEVMGGSWPFCAS